MGIRQKLNNASKGVVALVIIFVLGVYGVVAWEIRRPAAGGHANVRSYYTLDEGKTYFADDGALFPPFDYEGGQAVRCYVFTSPSSGEFVAYLEKFSPEMKELLEKPSDPTHPGAAPPINYAAGVLVKRLGDKTWVPEASPKGEAIVHDVKCPNGSNEKPAAVTP